jgi:hypothetical protein
MFSFYFFILCDAIIEYRNYNSLASFLDLFAPLLKNFNNQPIRARSTPNDWQTSFSWQSFEPIKFHKINCLWLLSFCLIIMWCFHWAQELEFLSIFLDLFAPLLKNFNNQPIRARSTPNDEQTSFSWQSFETIKCYKLNCLWLLSFFVNYVMQSMSTGTRIPQHLFGSFCATFEEL